MSYPWYISARSRSVPQGRFAHCFDECTVFFFSRSPALREGSSLTLAVSPYGSPVGTARDRGPGSLVLKGETSCTPFPCSTAASSGSGLVTRSAASSCRTSSSSPCFSFSSSPRLAASASSEAGQSLTSQGNVPIQATGGTLSGTRLPPRSGSMPNVPLGSMLKCRQGDVFADTFVDPNVSTAKNYKISHREKGTCHQHRPGHTAVQFCRSYQAGVRIHVDTCIYVSKPTWVQMYLEKNTGKVEFLYGQA